MSQQTSPIKIIRSIPTILSHPILFPDGTLAAPAVSFSADSDTGLYRIGANNIGLVVGGATVLDLAANTLALRNGTNAQQLNLYNTYTDASNYERIDFGWSSNLAFLKTTKIGTGTARTFAIQYANATSTALSIPTLTTSSILLANVAVSTAATTGRVRVVGGLNVTAASGTHLTLNLDENAAPTATSTLIMVPLRIAPTINYSNATPGAGSYEAMKIAVTETALPTGQNYLLRASAGSAGTTDIFRVTNAGHILQAEVATDPGTALLAADAEVAVYNKNDKFVIAYNNGGTVTYVSIPLDGSTTTWTHSTTAP